MSPQLQEFIDANGYGPFVLVALPMLALLLRAQATQEACNIAVIVIILIVGGMAAITGDFGLTVIHSALIPRESVWHDGMIAPSHLASASIKDGTVPFHILSPLSIGLSVMILLPGAYKLLALALTGIHLVLVFEARDELSVSTPAAEVSMGGMVEGRLAELRAGIALFMEFLRESFATAPSAAGDAAPEVPAVEEGSRRTYPEGTAPLPTPRPATG